MRSVDYFADKTDKYGIELTLSALGHSLDGVTFRAFLQPLRYKNKMYLDGTYSEIGYVDQAYYLYIGPPDIDICSLPEGAYVTFKGRKYNFTRSEEVTLGDEVIYYWSVLRATIDEGAES